MNRANSSPFLLISLMETLKVGIIQFDPKWNAVQDNLQTLEKLLASYEGKSDLVVLPEMFSTGFNIKPDNKLVQENAKVEDWMQNIAVWSGFALTGSVVKEVKGRLLNNMVMFTPDGKRFEYTKRHLFAFGRETDMFERGASREEWIYKGWRIRPALCYDLRFPVWLRNDTDYDLLLICANWPTERIEHWKLLLQARSIENLAFVAGCNRTGKEPSGLKYSGESRIFGFDGKPLMKIADENMSKITVLNKREMLHYREQYGFLQDRDSFFLPKK